MNDKQFFYGVWKLGGIVLCVAIVSASSCTANRHYQTRMLIENANVNPIEAQCALNSDALNYAPCIIEATK